MPHTPKITIFFTGGTISMTHAPDGSVMPALTGDDIRAAVPDLGKEFELSNVEFGRHPGPHMTPARVLDLAVQIKAAFAAGADGAVVTHGTDTIEETAFMLDLLHDDPRPIVIVGAMRTRDELSWDGPINLFSACLVAGDPASRGRGAMVVMNNTINAASEVTKTFTEALDTFVSPETGPLGIVDAHKVIYYRQPVRRVSVNARGFARVELVEAVSGCDSLLVDAAAASGCAGLVVNAMGRGNVPPLMGEGLERVLKRKIPVVICSRCWGGRVAPVYGYEGGGAKLLEAGAIFSPWMSGTKARLALGLALNAGYDDAKLRQLFDSPKAVG